jgi:hypothetical protein
MLLAPRFAASYCAARKLPKNTPQPRPGGQAGITLNQAESGAPAKKGCC